MRLLFLSDFYPPYELGGYEQWCQEVAERLEQRGHEVHILTSRHKAQNGAAAQAPRVERSLYLQADIDHYRPLDFFVRRPFQERENVRILRKSINRVAPDLVVVWSMWNLTLWLPYFAEEWLRGRVVYFVGSYWPIDPDLHTVYWQLPALDARKESLKRPLRKLVAGRLRSEGYPPELRFEHVLCCSEYVRTTLMKAGKLPYGAGVLIGGVDIEPFLRQSKAVPIHESEGEDLRLLFFGRLIHDKGVHTAIEAMGILKKQGLAERITLTILGSGHPDYEAELRRMVAELEMEERVRFVAKIPRQEIPEWISHFDVFLFTSIWPEPYGRVIVEAMAAGLAVIATATGGSGEIVRDQETGLVFAPGNAEELAGRIAQLHASPALRQGLAAAGRKLALEEHSLQHGVDLLEKYMQDILASGGSPGISEVRST